MDNKSTASKSRTTLVEVSRVNPSYRRGYITRRPSPLQVSRSTSRVTDLLLNELRLQLKSRGEIHRLEGRWHPLVPAFATGQRYRCARRVNQTSHPERQASVSFFFFAPRRHHPKDQRRHFLTCAFLTHGKDREESTSVQLRFQEYTTTRLKIVPACMRIPNRDPPPRHIPRSR